jgi:hypothetical protein
MFFLRDGRTRSGEDEDGEQVGGGVHQRLFFLSSSSRRRPNILTIRTGLPRSADIVRPARVVGFVPIVLQKSFCRRSQKF